MYVIYALVDPRDFLIRYVGLSENIYMRFKQHLRCEGTNVGKNRWIEELNANQEIPNVWNLETARDREEARFLEEEWIDRLLKQGFPLLNVVGAQDEVVVSDRLVPMTTTNFVLYRFGYRSCPEYLSISMQRYYEQHYLERDGKYYSRVLSFVISPKE